MAKTYSIEEGLKEVGKDIENMSQDMIKEARGQIKALAAQTHGLVVEKAQAKLKGQKRKIYLDSLSLDKLGDDSMEIWSVSLDKAAGWIEDDIAAGERIDMILNGGAPAKTSKDGNRYKIIPFSHKKTVNTPSSQVKMANFVKSELKKRGLDKIVSDPQGNPIVGKVASVDLVKDNKKGQTFVSKFNKPLLQGLTIYQNKVKNAQGKESIKQSVMTFRVISEKAKGSGDWFWPESKGAHIFEEVEKEVDAIFEKMMVEIVERYR
jgi:hypothetical protein